MNGDGDYVESYCQSAASKKTFARVQIPFSIWLISPAGCRNGATFRRRTSASASCAASLPTRKPKPFDPKKNYEHESRISGECISRTSVGNGNSEQLFCQKFVMNEEKQPEIVLPANSKEREN
jgi:hypothetical protein